MLLPFLAIAAAALLLFLYPWGRGDAPVKSRVVTVWNVDTFEGGKGSRANLLRKVARNVEKRREGVYYLISSYTAEGAAAAFSEGKYPDLLSFGVGLSDGAEVSLALPYSFAGGEISGECRAVPWCMGGYFLFSLTEDFTQAGRCAISVGGSNLGALAAAYAGIGGEEVESQAAYVGFLSGKYRYLLGTQRDVCRLTARGAAFFSRPLGGYNDLFQYISLLKEVHRDDALAFIEELLSPQTAELLPAIGMEPVKENANTRTPCVFSDAEALARLKELASEGDLKIPDKFLKTV